MPSPNVKAIMYHVFSGSFAENQRYGLKDMANPNFVNEVYVDDVQDRSEIRAGIVGHYARHPVNVTTSFPRDHTQYPCLVIQKANDSESSDSPLSNVFSSQTLNGNRETCKGARFDETIELYVAVANTDGDAHRDYIYLAVKEIYVRNLLFFERMGLRNIRWVSGSDGQINTKVEGIPLVMHTASIMIRFFTETLYTDSVETQPSSSIQSSVINEELGTGEVTPEIFKDER